MTATAQLAFAALAVPLFVLGVGLAPPRVELSPPVGGVVR
jgi:hypothetical protein